MIRLNKFLAQCGLGSRRKCDELIQAGKITVNGKVIKTLGFQVDDQHDEVVYEGMPLSPVESKIYILLNKPVGYVTTVKNGWGRKPVTELIPLKQRIFPVGRLDKDTEGLLLLTNDGNLCHILTHPKFHIDKIYQAKIDKRISLDDIKKLEQGVILETGVTAPCNVEILAADKTGCTLNIILREGKKRQIRRMFQTLGYSVVRLVRLQFANLTLDNLPVGKWRFLTTKEITNLKQISKQVRRR